MTSLFYHSSSHVSVFPTFLLPSIPFRRRRHPSTDSTSSNDSSTSTASSNTTTDTSSNSPEPISPTPQTKYLRGHISYLRCAKCGADLCLTSQIISKGFTGRHGRAYLVSGNSPTTTSLPNTYTGRAVPRQLVTGAHTVSDINCSFCNDPLGWKYIAAEEESQKYKIGKYILETKRVRGVSCWENEESEDANDAIAALPFNAAGDLPLPPDRLALSREDNYEAIEFDSEDEDECEDLFAGVWSQALAAKRRRGRMSFDGKGGSGSGKLRSRSKA